MENKITPRGMYDKYLLGKKFVQRRNDGKYTEHHFIFDAYINRDSIHITGDNGSTFYTLEEITLFLKTGTWKVINY